MSQFEIRPVPRQHTAVVHLRCRPEDISTTMGEGFGRVFAAIGKTGMVPAGPVFARYFEFSDQSIDFECGVAVATPFPGQGDVQPGELGGGMTAVGMHIGPYDTLAQTYGQLQAWIVSQGRSPGSSMWEVYLTDPEEEPDAARWRTEVYWPVS